MLGVQCWTSLPTFINFLLPWMEPWYSNPFAPPSLCLEASSTLHAKGTHFDPSDSLVTPIKTPATRFAPLGTCCNEERCNQFLPGGPLNHTSHCLCAIISFNSLISHIEKDPILAVPINSIQQHTNRSPQHVHYCTEHAVDIRTELARDPHCHS